jgi:hypothetical protein
MFVGPSSLPTGSGLMVGASWLGRLSVLFPVIHFGMIGRLWLRLSLRLPEIASPFAKPIAGAKVAVSPECR